MAPAIRRQNSNLASLLERLIAGDEHRFSFFQTVRLLENMYHKGKVPLGCGSEPAREVVRLRGWASLGFPAAEVHAVGFDPEREHDLDPSDPRRLEPAPIDRNNLLLPLDVTVTFMGLFGTHGVLPLHYTTLLRQRVRKRDYALRDFLDIFNHRLLSLFYRAWEKSCPVAARERALRGPTHRKEPVSTVLYSVAGFGTAGLQNRLAFQDDCLLSYAGLLAAQPRSREALEMLLRDFFEPLFLDGASRGRLAEFRLWPERRPLRVEPFVSRSYRLPLEEQTELGRQNESLGDSFVLGDEVAIEDSGLRVVVGPLSFGQFYEFLPSESGIPGRSAFRCLVDLVRLFCGPEIDFDVQLLLRPEDAHGFQLTAPGGSAARLGISTWLINEVPKESFSEGIYPSSLVETHGIEVRSA